MSPHSERRFLKSGISRIDGPERREQFDENRMTYDLGGSKSLTEGNNS
jgi:hypothetical protein